MGFYIDFEAISTLQYKEILKSTDLVKSRMILKENIHEIFDIIIRCGINNLEELQKALKTKKKLQEFAQMTKIDEEYLKILIREINSYKQSPVKIKDFLNISAESVKKLEDIGIRNSEQLFYKVLTKNDRLQLAKELAISEEEILKLTKLVDLTRIRWVNHTFANVLLEAGYESAKQVANADYNVLYETVKKLNEERQFYKAHIGLNDMKLTVNAAKDVPLEIEF